MGGPWYADNELLPVELSYDAGGADLTGYKLRLSHGSSVELWTTQKKDALVASEFTIGTDTIPTTIYVEGIDVGQSNINWRLEKSDPRGFLIIPMDDDSVTLTVVNHDLKAYRPQTEGPGYGNPFPKTAVPFSQEEAPGVGIRRNGDDDDGDGVDDLDPNDTAITGENDLIEVDFMMPTLLGIQYVLKRTNANINVFAQRDKGGAALLDDSDTDNEEVVVCNATGGACGAWVEWATLEAAQTQSILTLEVRTKTNDTRTDGKLTLSDKLKFYPFTSVVIAFGGNGQNPADTDGDGSIGDVADPNDTTNREGPFDVAQDLYESG